MIEISTTLKALADEGKPMSKEQLLRAVREKPSTPGLEADRPVQPNGVKPKQEWEGMVELTATRRPPSSNGRAPVEPDRDTKGTWWMIWTAPFRAIREFYWLLDPDAKCRSVGLRTVGRVDGTESEEYTDPETGSTSYTYYVRYSYRVDGRGNTDRKKVGSYGGLKKGGGIRVFYLPDTYPLKSAIDWTPLRSR